MKIDEIKHWRNCDILKQFFDIKCASTALEECTFGEVIDFLLDEIKDLETLVRFYEVNSTLKDC